MRILVDADACPVVKITEEIAKNHNIPVVLFCDTNHVLYSDYSEVVTVSAGADALPAVGFFVPLRPTSVAAGGTW